MGPLTYSLCKKPVIGFAMWITSLCAFPPPLPATELDLENRGAAVTKAFEVPLDHLYEINLDVKHSSAEARLNASPLSLGICGTNGAAATSSYRGAGGLPLRIRISDTKNERVVFEQEYFHPCKTGHTGMEESLQLSDLFLTKGTYLIEIVTLQAASDYASLKPALSIVAPRRK